jgi:hypothetical protein
MAILPHLVLRKLQQVLLHIHARMHRQLVCKHTVSKKEEAAFNKTTDSTSNLGAKW